MNFETYTADNRNHSMEPKSAMHETRKKGGEN